MMGYGSVKWLTRILVTQMALQFSRSNCLPPTTDEHRRRVETLHNRCRWLTRPTWHQVIGPSTTTLVIVRASSAIPTARQLNAE